MASTSSSRLVIAAGDKGQAGLRGTSCDHAPRIHPSSSTTAPRGIGINTMTTLTCLLATVLAVLTIPLVILWRLSLPPQQHALRLRSYDWTDKQIGSQLHFSATTARQ